VKSSTPEPRGTYAFGRFRLSADGTLLMRDGVRVAVAPKVLQTLLALVQRAGHVVRKGDLLQAVWPDSFVEETGLTRNMSLLRRALDDEAQTVIVTVARIGYRFAAPVVLADAPVTSSPMIDEAFSAADGSVPRAEADPNEEREALTRLLILPFRLLREDPEIGFLAFSVPDAIVSALSGLTSLVVRSSAAAARFAGESPDLQRIATEAGVDAVVNGTLLRSGQQIRVTATLLAVPCGTVLLSQSLQVTLREIFELQDVLVARIVNSLSLSLTARDERRLKSDVPASPGAYEFFLRGNECIGPQGIASSSNLRVARELYVRAIEEDPRFAPAWARLGRCHYLIGKADENRDQNLARAESCFQKALELSPDLPVAHNLYALFEIDQGRARSAMVRLISRALAESARPELFAGLVQACRFCGLLEASVVAHRLARALDPAVPTSGYQAFWQLGDDEGALREGVCPALLEPLIIGMRGEPGRAIELLRAREALGPTGLARSLFASLRGVFEGRPDTALENATFIFDEFPDPEAVFHAARNLAFFADPRALTELGRSLDRGFVLYRVLLKDDPWLDPLRSAREFQVLFERSRETYRECLAAYVDAGGERLLGHVPSPDELESRIA
jgi:eukaryotic-like serine/threonine-protein kinase